MNVVGLRRAHTVCVAGLRRRFLRRVQLGLALVVAQHREALAGLTARALLALNALLAARALRADRAGLAGVALLAACAGCTRCAGLPLGADGALFAAQSLKLRRREVGIGEGISLLSLLAFLPSGADCSGISLGADLTARTGCAGRADGAALAGNAALALLSLVSLGAGVALRAGRGYAGVSECSRCRVPLEPVPRRAVHVGHLGHRRLRARPGLEHLVHPALIRRRRRFCAFSHRRAHARLVNLAFGDYVAHRVAQLCAAFSGYVRVRIAHRPEEHAALFAKRYGIRRRVALSLHDQAECTARAVGLSPFVCNVEAHPARLVFSLTPEVDLLHYICLFFDHLVTSLMRNGAARATFFVPCCAVSQLIFVFRGVFTYTLCAFTLSS